MQISWNGLGSFTITAKPVQGDVTVVTDPYNDDTGLKMPRALAATMVVASHKGKMASNVGAVAGEEKKAPFLVDYPGEYEVSGVFVHAVRAPKKDGTEHTIFRITAEGLRIGFLGSLDRTLTNDEVEKLGTVDVLIVPVGGGDVLGKDAANDVVAQIEPSMVIPSHYDTKGLKITREGVDGFCKAVACPMEEVNKLTVKKSTLPTEDMKIVVLAK